MIKSNTLITDSLCWLDPYPRSSNNSALAIRESFACGCFRSGTYKYRFFNNGNGSSPRSVGGQNQGYPIDLSCSSSSSR